MQDLRAAIGEGRLTAFANDFRASYCRPSGNG
jgi:hypothetical protein